MPRRSRKAQEAELWGRLLFAHRRVSDALARGMDERAGIPLAWYEVLLILSSVGDRKLRLQDLEPSVLYSQSGLSRLIDRMVTAGLVVRERASHDRRGVCVRMTTSGQRAFKRAAPVYLNGIEEHFLSRMSNEERQLLRSILDRICNQEERAGHSLERPREKLNA